MSLSAIPLGTIMAERVGSVDPMQCPDEAFDLYSIPAFDRGVPESVLGSQVGSTKQIVQPGDVLLSKIVPHIRRAWVVGPANGRRIIASSEWIVFRSPRIVPQYLRHALTSDQFHQRFMGTVAGVGGSLLRARPAHVAALSIPLPFPDDPKRSLAEQKRIAAILDKADAIRRKQQLRCQDAIDLARSAFAQLFGNPARNDRNWPLVTVQEAGEVQLGRQRAPSYQTGRFTTPYLRVANVYEDELDLSDVLSMDFDESDSRQYRLEPGDILLNEGQSTELVGRPAMYLGEIPGCCFQNTLVRFRANLEKVDPEYALGLFLNYLHEGRFARISSKTSSVAHLGAARFAAMPFPLPPLPLQREYGRTRRKTRELQERFSQLASESNALFASLVNRAFEGAL